MGQKVNPISNRLGIIRGWDSNWFGGKNFGDNLVEDQQIRKYLEKRLEKAQISRIIIERTLKLVTITICTARPGIVIGKGGQDVDKLKEELKKLYKKDIQINIFEVKRPELDACIVGKNIASQIEHLMAYRRAIKMAVQNTMRAGAEGIKIQITGRLNGAEMARKEVIDEAGLLKLMAERTDLKFVTDIMPDATEEFAKFEGRYFTTPKKMGAQTAEANNNAGIAAARQINSFFATGDETFRVNK